ncbi:hypothetical protein AAH951_01825 [Campylobacter coli]
MTAYVHIGTVKTGTTTIQNFLLNNTDKFLKQRLCFSDFLGRKNSGKDVVLDSIWKIDKYTRNNIKEELKNKTHCKILFSTEGLHANCRNEKQVLQVFDFFKEIGFSEIKIIIYLRAIEDLVPSLYSQMIKHNFTISNLPIMSKNYRFYHDCDYKTLKMWINVFGKENLIVRLFDKNEFYQGDLLKDFIHSIGLEWDDEFIIPSKQNESLDLLGIKLFSLTSQKNVKNGIIQTWYPFCKYFQSKDPHLKFQPSREIMQSYIDYFEESNEWVRKEFFPHKERLFPKKDLTNYKENYELKEMKPEYWDRIAEFIADIVKTKNQAIQNKDNQIIAINNEKTNLQTQINQLQNTLNALPIKKQQLEISNLEQDLINKKLQTKQLERQLGLVSNDAVVSHGNKITIIHPNSAKTRIQNQLSYKLGQAMIVNSKSLLGYIRMPFVLSYIHDKHKQEQKIYQEKIKKDPSLKLPPLESYPDYKEALKEKECLTYKLGEALIKASNNWYGGGYIKLLLEIRKLKREFRKKANHA